MAHHKPAKMKNTKATDKGINKYKMSMLCSQRDEWAESCVVSISGKALDRRSALSTTPSELRAMPKPAAHAGSHPTTASGTHAAL
jgi:hypothetical protein